jgi:hypothetical protein
MRAPWLKVAGIIAIILLAAGMTVRAVMAISNSEPFTGANYWGAPVGPALILPVVVIGALGGLWWIIRRSRQ